MNNYQSKNKNLALGAAALAIGLLWALIENIDFPLGIPTFSIGTIPGIGQAQPTSMPNAQPISRLLEA